HEVMRRWSVGALIAAGALGMSVLPVHADGPAVMEPPVMEPARAEMTQLTLAEISRQAWNDAKLDQEDDLRRLVSRLADNPPADLGSLTASYKSLEAAFDKREQQRQDKLKDVEEKLAEQLTKG